MEHKTCKNFTSSAENDTFTKILNCSKFNLDFSNSSDSYHNLFNEDSFREIITYAVLFVFAAAGNVSVFVSLLKNRRRKSRIKIMIIHLSIADMIVTFIMIPLEICWRITIAWIAGDAMCKIMLFLRAFGPYLSSMVLVCISLDRYFAIVHPLKVNDSQRRGKLMLIYAWIISILCSIPQSVIFSVQKHPDYPNFAQCVSFNFFAEDYQMLAYNLFCLAALYLGPLLIIILCYAKILCQMFKRSRDTRGDMSQEQQLSSGRFRLRRSDISHIERSRNRTLRMTIVIVLAFFCCWTPYVMMALWYLIDPDSADKVDSRIQSSLFMFAVSNSCVNPLVYGSYTLNFSSLCRKFFRRLRHPASMLPSRQASTASRATHIDRYFNDCRSQPQTPPPRAVCLRMKQFRGVTSKNILSPHEGKDDPEFHTIISSSSNKSCDCDGHPCSVHSATLDVVECPLNQKESNLSVTRDKSSEG